MFSKQEKEIESVENFINIIKDITSNSDKFVYRGQNSHRKYKLLPSILRENSSSQRVYTKNCEGNFLNKFKSRSISYLKYMPKDDWEWLFVMQHYSCPTRLLDWSESPLVALYFALENSYETPEDSPVIWCLKPLELNKKFKAIAHGEEIPAINSNDLVTKTIENFYGIGRFTDIEYPLTISAPLNNDRISAQRGIFTLFGHNSNPIEELGECNDFLEKIVIKKEKIKNIKRELFRLGITSSTIYPELDSISKDIKAEYLFNNASEV